MLSTGANMTSFAVSAIPQKKRSLIMEKKLKAAVIGLGMGNSHAQAILQHKDTELFAICDINPNILNSVGSELGVPESHRFTDWRDLLTIRELNVVLIVTPDQLHREMCEAFLAAGVHVMCEKPLALSREDLTAIVRAADRADTKFMVGQICRFTPAFIKAKELIDQGIIGEIYYLESEYAHDYAKILHSDSWRSDPERHGVIGGGCHAVDLLRWYAGDPVEAFAYGNHKLLPQVAYDDATISVLKFPNDVIGKVFVSTACKRPYTMRTLIYGTKGTIICDNTSDHMLLYTIAENDVLVNPEPTVIPIDINNHNTVHEFSAFADHILCNTPVQMDALQGAKTIAACMAIVESSKSGMPVTPDYDF